MPLPKIMTAPAQRITAPAQLITAPTQQPATGLSCIRPCFFYPHCRVNIFKISHLKKTWPKQNPLQHMLSWALNMEPKSIWCKWGDRPCFMRLRIFLRGRVRLSISSSVGPSLGPSFGPSVRYVRRTNMVVFVGEN